MKADLQTGNVIGSFTNTKPKVTFNYPWDPQPSHEQSNQKIPSFARLDPHKDETCVTKCETSTPKINSNQLDTIPRQSIEKLYLPQFGAETQTSLKQNIDR